MVAATHAATRWGSKYRLSASASGRGSGIGMEVDVSRIAERIDAGMSPAEPGTARTCRWACGLYICASGRKIDGSAGRTGIVRRDAAANQPTSYTRIY